MSAPLPDPRLPAPKTFALLRRNQHVGTRVREIMGLPNDDWSSIAVSFGMDEVPAVTITFIPTAAQIVALAQLAADPGVPAAVPAPVREQLLGA